MRDNGSFICRAEYSVPLYRSQGENRGLRSTLWTSAGPIENRVKQATIRLIRQIKIILLSNKLFHVIVFP